MTGFSAQWLALRDGADRRARSAALDMAVAQALAPLALPRIADLGAGTGANLLALAPRLGPHQHWLLLDHDAALADAARDRLAAAAQDARTEGADLLLRLGGKAVRVSFATVDLAAAPAAALAFKPDLVTASAFFDLVSADWCRRFAAALAGAGVAMHAALTCDGADEWLPAHEADAPVLAAFRADQRRDKGFGPAAGPEAGAILAAAFEAEGYQVLSEKTPWELGPDDGALIAALAEGTAGVARNAGLPEETVTAWQASRTHATSCRIGHVDLFARPKAP